MHPLLAAIIAKRRRRQLLLGRAAVSAVTSTLVNSSFTGASGTLTFTARDAMGNLLAGVPVTLSVDAEALVSASLSQVLASTELIADDGVESSAIQLALRDTDDDPVVGFAVAQAVLAVSGSDNTVTQPGAVSTVGGIMTGSFVSTGAGTKVGSYAAASLAITDTATVVVSGDSGEIDPGGSDIIWYNDTFTDTATWAARRTKYNDLVTIGDPAAIFEAPADAADTEITPTMVTPGYDGSDWAIEIAVAAGFPHGDEVRCNFPIRFIGGLTPMASTDTLFIDMWMKIEWEFTDFLWMKGLMAGHPGGGSGASGDRTQYGFYRSSATLGYANINPQSQIEIHMHQEDGASGAPVLYKRWDDINGAGYLRHTFTFKKSTTTGSTRDGVARWYIEGEKIIDASLFGRDNGFMESRQTGVAASSTDPYPGNVDEKYGSRTGDQALLLLADEIVNALVFPGIIGVYGQGTGSGKITIGRIRGWRRPA